MTHGGEELRDRDRAAAAEGSRAGSPAGREPERAGAERASTPGGRPFPPGTAARSSSSIPIGSGRRRSVEAARRLRAVIEPLSDELERATLRPRPAEEGAMTNERLLGAGGSPAARGQRLRARGDLARRGEDPGRRSRRRARGARAGARSPAGFGRPAGGARPDVLPDRARRAGSGARRGPLPGLSREVGLRVRDGARDRPSRRAPASLSGRDGHLPRPAPRGDARHEQLRSAWSPRASPTPTSASSTSTSGS